MIPDNLHNSNLATTFPTTPSRPAPNSAKKRRQMSDLSRPAATPGHGAKMSMIFRNAATSLQGSRLPTYQPSSNIKRPRLPLSQARSTKFGSTCQDDIVISSDLRSPPKISQYLGESCETGSASSEVSRHRAFAVGPHYPTRTPLKIEDEEQEPISSGFATPIAATPDIVEDPEEVKYPFLENWRSLRSSSDASDLGSDNIDLHSTHGVPLILPFPRSDAEEASRSHIDTWLDEIVNATSGLSRSPRQCDGTKDLLINNASRTIVSNLSSPIRPGVSPSKKQDLPYPLGASSDKENISPSKCSSSPTLPPTQHLQSRNPSRFRQSTTQSTLQHTKTLHFAPPLTPPDRHNLSPKRKRARVDQMAFSRAEGETSVASRDFTIHEDQLAEALAQLSPDVARHRKGRGPKRERCMSYWDEDILQPGSPCVPMDTDDGGEIIGRGKGKQVLNELEQTVEPTTERPFAKKAGSASFQFRA